MEIRVRDNSVAVLGFHDGGAGQVASWFEACSGHEIACYVLEDTGPFEVDVAAQNQRRGSQRTEYPRDGRFCGKPFLVSLNWMEELLRLGISQVLPLTPDNRQRVRQIMACEAAGISLVTAIHPTALVLDHAIIAPGVYVSARAIVGFKAELAAGVLLNTGVQIDHHNVLERGVQCDPGVTTAGFVTLRECAHIHTGATIINRREVGADAIVGAGAVVICDVPERTTVVGVPARPLTRR